MFYVFHSPSCEVLGICFLTIKFASTVTELKQFEDFASLGENIVYWMQNPEFVTMLVLILTCSKFLMTKFLVDSFICCKPHGRTKGTLIKYSTKWCFPLFPFRSNPLSVIAILNHFVFPVFSTERAAFYICPRQMIFKFVSSHS